MILNDSTGGDIRPRTRLVVGTASAILGLTALSGSILVSPTSWWAHGMWCIAAVGVVSFILRDVLALGVRAILTDHFSMLALAFLVYFIVGALLPILGRADEVQYSFSYYPVSAVDALRVDAANGIGFGVALIVGSLANQSILARATHRVSRLTTRVGPRLAICAFLVVGGLASAYVTTADLGLRTGLVSGIWRSLSKLILVGIFLGAAYRGHGERTMLVTAILVAVLEAASGLLLLSKSAVLLPIGALVAALSLRYRNRYVLLLGFGGMTVIFVLLGSYAAFGRNSLPEQLSPTTAIETRLSIAMQGLELTANPGFRSTYSPWSRISYLPAQTAGMDFFETGRGGDDIGRIPWLFVPRVIAPSKPSITQTSADFHTKITGREGSHTGQGVFVSAYYNAGWPGLVIISAICGWILVQTSAIARTIIARRDALLFPFALLGVYMAFRIDGHFISDYFGAFVFLLYALAAGNLLSNLVIRPRLRFR